jgi:hypothetical protein
VLGGGGIIPDVPVDDSATTAMQQNLQHALGKHIPELRDALTAYAIALKARGTITSPSFTVTPQMRLELYDLLRQRNVVIPRPAYDAAAALVDRLLGYQIARYIFGLQAEFERTTRDDPVIRAASSLLVGVKTQHELLRKAETAGRSDLSRGKS